MGRSIIKKLALWIALWLTLFLLLLFVFIGPIQQTVFTGEINLVEGSAKVYIESENNKILYTTIYASFGALIIIALIWSAVRIYEVKHKLEKLKK